MASKHTSTMMFIIACFAAAIQQTEQVAFSAFNFDDSPPTANAGSTVKPTEASTQVPSTSTGPTSIAVSANIEGTKGSTTDKPAVGNKHDKRQTDSEQSSGGNREINNVSHSKTNNTPDEKKENSTGQVTTEDGEQTTLGTTVTSTSVPISSNGNNNNDNSRSTNQESSTVKGISSLNGTAKGRQAAETPCEKADKENAKNRGKESNNSPITESSKIEVQGAESNIFTQTKNTTEKNDSSTNNFNNLSTTLSFSTTNEKNLANLNVTSRPSNSTVNDNSTSKIKWWKITLNTIGKIIGVFTIIAGAYYIVTSVR